MGKMFALVRFQGEKLQINLKSNPHEASLLRGMFDAVKPGYHMNKDHWNTVVLDGSLPEDMLLKMIEDSYALVVQGLRKVDQGKLEAL